MGSVAVFFSDFCFRKSNCREIRRNHKSRSHNRWLLCLERIRQSKARQIRGNRNSRSHSIWLLCMESNLNQPEAAVAEFIAKHTVKALNIAGSRESKEPGIHQWVMKVLNEALFWSDDHPGILGGPGEG